MNDDKATTLRAIKLCLTATLISLFFIGLHVLDARSGPDEFNFSVTYWRGDANPFFATLGQVAILGGVIGSFLTGALIEELSKYSKPGWKKFLITLSGPLAMAGGLGLIFTMTCAPKWFTMLVLLSCFIGVLAAQLIRPNEEGDANEQAV